MVQPFGSAGCTGQKQAGKFSAQIGMPHIVQKMGHGDTFHIDYYIYSSNVKIVIFID